MTATVLKMPTRAPKASQIRCLNPNCSATADAPCECGVGFVYVKAGKLVAEAIAKPENEEKSNRALAEELGVAPNSVRKARQATGQKCPVEKRTGRDGKKRATTPKKARTKRDAVKDAIFDKPGLTEKEIAEHIGLDPASSTVRSRRKELEREGVIEARKKDGETIFVPAEPEIPPMSKTKREEFDRIIAAHKRYADAQMELRKQAEIAQWLKKIEAIFAKEKEDAELVLKHRKGVFTQIEYNSILRCLHPDGLPTQDQRQKAFVLFNEHKIILVAEKEFPTDYPPLPTSFAELLRRK